MFNIMYTIFLKLTLISKAFLTNIARVQTFSSMHTQMCIDYYYYEKISYIYHKRMDVLQYVHINVYLDHLYY